MKTIATEGMKVIKLLGKQQEEDTEYRMMHYVLQTECEDGMLLHNVITGHLVLLDDEEARMISRLPSKPVPDLKELIEAFFLVPVVYDEKAVVHKLRLLMKHLFAPKGINSYLILPTTNCNARCAYCFEKGVRLMNMGDDTANKVVNYIASHKSKPAVKLHWFGGEPLVGANRIDQICEGLRERNVNYHSVMTSNGYLFTEQVVDRAVKEWNLEMVQITLDGTEAVYNKVKDYIAANENPFRKVISNISLLLKVDIHVILRLNLDEHNAEDLRRLVTDLNLIFTQKENLNVYASKVMNLRSEEEEQKLDMLVNGLNEYIDQLGMYKHDPVLLALKTNSCMADSDEALVILPDGQLAKCENIRDEDVVGNLDSEINTLNTEAIKEIFEFDYCNDCPIYPSCILLRACPTKKIGDQMMCQRSILRYREDMVEWYETRREKTGFIIEECSI